MRLNKRRRPFGAAMDMTPMIDVTFQLIIFFMTVSQVSQTENEQLQLPQMAGTLDQGRVTLTINATHDDRILVSGTLLTLAQLEGLVAREISQKEGHPELLSIVLRVDKRSTSALVNKIFTSLRKSGIQRSRIAVEVPGPGA